MVKFGRRLDSEAFPSWAEHYIDYRALKGLVYAAKEDDAKAGHFLNALGSEIEKVRVYYNVGCGGFVQFMKRRTC